METTMNRLETITHNNKRNRVRDVMFACFVALAAALAITTVTNALDVTSIVQR
jgi:hypothetical protein